MQTGNHQSDVSSAQVYHEAQHARSESATDIDRCSAMHSGTLAMQNGGLITTSDFQNSSSDSENGMPPTTPSDDDYTNTSEDNALKPKLPQPPEKSLEVQIHHGCPYVKLNDDYDRWLCWSNDPNDLYLATYFDPNQPVNLARDFKVDGLCPVVKEDDSDQFILRDGKGRYYLWDAWDGHLLRFQDDWTKGFPSKEKLVEHLVCNLTWAEKNTDIIYADREED